MAICPVCGCKTDELDFVKGSVNGVERDICSFCHRQISGFGNNPSGAQVKWLGAVLNKEVSRDEQLQSALKELFDENSTGEMYVEQISASSVPSLDTKISSEDFDDKDKVIAQLVKRVEMLEKELVSMKRRQMIKTIVEILLPVILGIVILIVFFSSGLFDALTGLYDQFMM